ncbi:MAG: hypothetical protein JRE71_09205 [Deltaproteobacteria bacterium]|nr:hypothetical protein [Deltaproteobacteria bacterium]
MHVEVAEQDLLWLGDPDPDARRAQVRRTFVDHRLRYGPSFGRSRDGSRNQNADAEDI